MDCCGLDLKFCTHTVLLEFGIGGGIIFQVVNQA
jgi:hypothetical protein